jgi:hypothetical protein
LVGNEARATPLEQRQPERILQIMDQRVTAGWVMWSARAAAVTPPVTITVRKASIWRGFSMWILALHQAITFRHGLNESFDLTKSKLSQTLPASLKNEEGSMKSMLG